MRPHINFSSLLHLSQVSYILGFGSHENCHISMSRSQSWLHHGLKRRAVLTKLVQTPSRFLDTMR